MTQQQALAYAMAAIRVRIEDTLASITPETPQDLIDSLTETAEQMDEAYDTLCPLSRVLAHGDIQRGIGHTVRYVDRGAL